ncbi:MAG: 1-acyl-sn-glycerol-3-phosphate acyltransferase [Gammaproteobacteria bacterium]|nr:1-acyl-sn-glycerol-3-phosphate acyltransferase [Gammaproteobacteria bacterium]
MTHIVDTLIEERAIRLMRHAALWEVLKRGLYPLLLYDTARRMADVVAPMSAEQTFDYLLETLAMDVAVTGLDNIPREGLVFVTPNHPAGIADGIAVYEALRRVRPDITFFANRDAIRISPALAEVIVPVEWREEERTRAKARETLRAANRAFRAGRLVVVFPSGRLARPTPIGLWERPWQATAFALAQKHDAPIVPMHIRGHNSLLYYCFWFLNRELKDMTLFREVVNKRGRSYRIDVGELFEPRGEPNELAPALRRFVVRDMRRGARRFEAGETL